MTTAVATGKTQVEAVKQVMLDGQFRTLAQLVAAVEPLTGKKATETSISARLRDLRKPEHGNYHIEREGTGDGLFKYRLVRKDVPADTTAPAGPANPIPSFGKAHSNFNVAGTQSGRTYSEVPNNPTPVSGATSANRFLDEMKAGTLSVGK